MAQAKLRAGLLGAVDDQPRLQIAAGLVQPPTTLRTTAAAGRLLGWMSPVRPKVAPGRPMVAPPGHPAGLAHPHLVPRPPARLARGTALEVPEAGHPGDLGPPVLPLRDPLADVRRRRPGRPRPGPSLVRRRAAHIPAVHRPTGRFSPLTHATPSDGSGLTRSANSSPGSYPDDDPEPTPAWSNASTPGGTSNDPITTTGPSPTGYLKKLW